MDATPIDPSVVQSDPEDGERVFGGVEGDAGGEVGVDLPVQRRAVPHVVTKGRKIHVTIE